jgi:hypothetical protein
VGDSVVVGGIGAHCNWYCINFDKMKTDLKNMIEVGKLVELVKTDNESGQYRKELINYLDLLHHRIKTLEMKIEFINDIAKSL